MLPLTFAKALVPLGLVEISACTSSGFTIAPPMTPVRSTPSLLVSPPGPTASWIIARPWYGASTWKRASIAGSMSTSSICAEKPRRALRPSASHDGASNNASGSRTLPPMSTVPTSLRWACATTPSSPPGVGTTVRSTATEPIGTTTSRISNVPFESVGVSSSWPSSLPDARGSMAPGEILWSVTASRWRSARGTRCQPARSNGFAGPSRSSATSALPTLPFTAFAVAVSLRPSRTRCNSASAGSRSSFVMPTPVRSPLPLHFAPRFSIDSVPSRWPLIDGTISSISIWVSVAVATRSRAALRYVAVTSMPPCPADVRRSVSAIRSGRIATWPPTPVNSAVGVLMRWFPSSIAIAEPCATTVASRSTATVGLGAAWIATAILPEPSSFASTTASPNAAPAFEIPVATTCATPYGRGFASLPENCATSSLTRASW